MSSFRIEVTRGDRVESLHRVSAVAVDERGRVVATAGNPDLVTFWRSSAKPFQALPLLDDGVTDRFELTDEDLAIATASHSSEPVHLEAVDRFLRRIGASEAELACGPHPPISNEVAREVIRSGTTLTPRWSNCSGKHTGMLALARRHGWPVAGYHRLDHPLQRRMMLEVCRWTGLEPDELELGVDGCRVVSFGLPLAAMALAYARFGTAEEPGPRRLWRAVTSHPVLVAGSTRFDTHLMQAWPGEVFAKVGAEGVYCAAVPSRGIGIALKVEDGAWRAAPIALLAMLRAVLAAGGVSRTVLERLDGLSAYREPPVLDTHDEPVGVVRAAGDLRFEDP